MLTIKRQVYIDGKWIDERREVDREAEKDQKVYTLMLKEVKNELCSISR